MNAVLNFDQCASVLTRQIELLREISAAQDNVKKAVINREWVNFDEKTEELNRLGENFAQIEDERASFFSSMNMNMEEKSFYASISGLPLEQRSEISRLYRDLKTETLKMRSLNETFLAYINEAKSLAAAYIEAVCPARGGKLYTRKGQRVSQDLSSIVINNSF